MTHADENTYDERLTWMLRVLGDEFGPLGVAKVAAEMCGARAIPPATTQETR